ERKSILHNQNIWHSKVVPSEAVKLVDTVCERLATAKKPVTLVVPTKGGCQTTSPGGPIADPAIDEMMVERFRERVSPNTKLVIVDAAVNDPEFAKVVADEFKILLKAYGWE
ncbi:MAG: Tm-1-like ATP-binding domain-containing protein, partial [Erysipelotrichaceae bacterium]|nr:Tm-1-like ATP-binding domain-containing protein [Erysipelotrichaceae bacterium]